MEDKLKVLHQEAAELKQMCNGLIEEFNRQKKVMRKMAKEIQDNDIFQGQCRKRRRINECKFSSCEECIINYFESEVKE